MQEGGSTNKAAFECTALYDIMTGRSSTFLTFIRCDGQTCIIDIPCVGSIIGKLSCNHQPVVSVSKYVSDKNFYALGILSSMMYSY